ncbi:hypothetical protein HAX54_028905 [Datura stramonium]|uniref:Uncharacterized protein n=1 Tax=Datura stramonium TaxID=4076 RepID=A0ABS8S9W0_DATST|nr:hypothetical protein [Datura stramonium]
MPFHPYFPEFVKEFNASYRARWDILKHKGKVDKMPHFSSMLIWGKEVPITSDKINYIFCNELVCPSRDFKRKLADKDDQLEWVAKKIVVGQPYCPTTKGVIHRHDLKFEAGMWLD